MKFPLLKYTTLAIAASSGVDAHEDTSRLRGTNPNSIRCTHEHWFGDMSSIDRACYAFDDDVYTVPYECSGDRDVCCTPSNIMSPKLEGFGTCHKVESYTPQRGEDPPEKPDPSLNSIHCTYKSWFSDEDIVDACADLDDGEHTEPYECDGGRDVCCTYSNIKNVNMDSFGRCSAVEDGYYGEEFISRA